jgi:transcriptional regulator with XRE-family HTH domain
MAQRKTKAKKKTSAARKPTAKKKKTTKKKKARQRKEPMDRSAQMQEMREQGYTFGAIAEEFGVSRQRVHQLVSGARSAEEASPKTNNNEPRADLLRGRGIQQKLEQFHNPETVGDRIVYRRLKVGWTIGQLSQESGVPYGVLSTYENNKAEPSCESLRKLCMALRVSAHWLIFGQGFKKAKA